jgi:hypothetical protein
VKKTVVALLFALCATVQAQTYCIATSFPQQFFSNTGQPLAGGFLYTCSAGGSCPGSPQPTWTDGSGFTTNSNPVVLDASGRANVWINSAILYKFVLSDSTNTTVKTTDNLSCAAGGGGGPTTQYWSLTGSSIVNTNGGGSGAVTTTSDLTSGGNLFVTGALKLISSGSNSANVSASPAMTASVSWRWPKTDAVGCLVSDGSGNLTFSACSGVGGSPGGPNQSVQFNNSTAFGGSANLTWNNSAQLLTVTAASSSVQGIVNLVGYVQSDNGFAAVNNATPTTPLNYNVIQAPYGGMAALSFTASNYVETGSSSGAPTATTGESGFPHLGTIYCDTGSTPCVEKLWNGSAWVTLATGGATSPGGSNTYVQYNASGSFGGDSNLVYFPTSGGGPELVVTAASSSVPGFYTKNGFIQSDAGFLALPATATRYNVIQAPAGGMAAQSFTASNYIQTGQAAGPFATNPPPLTSTDTFKAGAISWDLSASALKVYNGTTWNTVGGGGGVPGSPNTSVQFNNSGAFGGSANFTWSNSGQVATITALSASTQGLIVLNGYAQADVGFVAVNNAAPSTPLQYNAIQAPTGGLYGRSLRATTYTQIGISAGIPTLTSGDVLNPGAEYYDTSLAVPRYYDGFTWHNFAAGGLTSLNSLTGAVNIVGTTNEISVTPSGTSITLATPQAIATTSTPTFAAVIANGAFNSTVTGLTTAFTTNTGTWSVDGQGDMSGNGSANMNGATGLGAYRVGGTIIVDNARNATFTSVVANGAFNSTVTGATTAYTANGGQFIVNGQGDISGAGSINMAGLTGLGSYRVNGTIVIDNARNATFNNVTIGGTCIGCSGGVSSIFGTGNEIIASASTGSVTLSTPQPIGTSSNVNFGSLAIGGNTIITSSGAILAPSGQNIETGATFAVVGGFFGIDRTGGITIGGCTLYFKSGILYNAVGC